MSERPVRRVVTGHNAQGQAIIQEDGSVPRTQKIGGGTGPLFHEVWNTRATPAPIDADSGEPPEEGIILAPPANGTRIRVLDIPPDDDSLSEMTPEQAKAHFAEIGAADASSFEGELVLIMDEGETTVRAGDIVVQRGTNHGWANRTNENCRIAFILIDGVFDESLKQ